MRLAPALFRTSVWLSSVLVAGCGLLRSHEDTTHGEDAVYRISGRISVDEERGVPIVVALLRTQPGTPELVVTDHTQLFHPGSYDFLVSAGRYRIVVFEDADHDLSFDDDERCNSYDDFRELVVDGAHPTTVDLRIGAGSFLDRSLPPIAMGDAVTRGLAIGDVVARDDVRISEESGVLGAWEPVHYMEQGRAGIFQLAAHDPTRTPVLFVHGFAGWGRQFDHAIDALDRDRFEPWIAAYPSGWTLGDIARVFRAALNEMLTLTGAPSVCLVAHSMGGLVSWRMLTDGEGDLVAAGVRGFVTMASPLGGHPSAATGLRMSPVIVPAWRDLSPDSALVHAVASAQLPTSIRYTLLFGYTPSQDGDGVVPLQAQLPRFAQDAATRVAGFETTHVGILSDDAALGELARALDACAPPAPIPTAPIPTPDGP